jgi:four helix bundle protein
MLSFQRLDAYQRAIEFLALVYDIVAELPRGKADCADQLMRSAASVVRNIAEGAGRWSEADSASRYKIARQDVLNQRQRTSGHVAVAVAVKVHDQVQVHDQVNEEAGARQALDDSACARLLAQATTRHSLHVLQPRETCRQDVTNGQTGTRTVRPGIARRDCRGLITLSCARFHPE